jgi:hypothetical protein
MWMFFQIGLVDFQEFNLALARDEVIHSEKSVPQQVLLPHDLVRPAYKQRPILITNRNGARDDDPKARRVVTTTADKITLYESPGFWVQILDLANIIN